MMSVGELGSHSGARESLRSVADLSRRVCCLLRMEGLDSKMWGRFLFLPVATAAAAAIPTGPETKRARGLVEVQASALKKYILQGLLFIFFPRVLENDQHIDYKVDVLQPWAPFNTRRMNKGKSDASSKATLLHKVVHWRHLLFICRHRIIATATDTGRFSDPFIIQQFLLL